MTTHSQQQELRLQAIYKLKEIQSYTDTEIAHSLADGVLTELLDALGFEDVVHEWEQIHKWYA